MIEGTGLRLKVLRTQNRLSQRQVAERTGIAGTTISAYENGDTTPSGDNLIKLATLYKASADYILCLENRHSIVLDTVLSDDEVSMLRTLVQAAIDFRNAKE